MRETFKSKYCTLDKIPDWKLQYIELRLNWFIELLDLKSSQWPIDCKEILEKLKASQFIRMDYTFIDATEKFDGLAQFIPEINFFMIYINKNKDNDTYEKRLNFTLAHEFGHMFLGHLDIPDELKTQEDRDMENLEADEFAGRFLMPEGLIVSLNYFSLASTANYLMVSKNALWTRLNNLKRLDVLNSRTIRTCVRCGNYHFSAFSEYCGICGEPLASGLKGIRRVLYNSQIKIDGYKRVVECPLCKFNHFTGDKCSRCGTYMFNYCTDYITKDSDDCSFANSGNSRYCELCGKPTYFYKRGLLSSWQSEVDENEIYNTTTI